ncbi:protein AAR2 homolog [Neocloeon triangulifer]|uniref:protein AAR2 homolog n=1 Tax=Neocloeon triangulifer TaxID=2078957 RepID=UPI00286F630B|nr:protein AAR2 homolog [Neocloeon triangulifer]
MEMDQELAKRMLIEGGTLAFLDVPEGTEFGMDMKTWVVDYNFKGMKMIPPGVHYISYSARNKHGDVSPRVGFFHNFKKSEILVRKWDTKEEDISLENATEEDISRIRSNLLHLDKYLAPYPFETYRDWIKLSDGISDEVLARLSPEKGLVRSALELESIPESSQKRRRTLDKEEALLPQLTPKAGTALRVTEVPEFKWPEGASAAEITKHSLDSSFALEKIISSHKNPLDYVGEMQICYICFLVGHSLEAFEQWKALLLLLCSSEDALSRQRAVFSRFLTVMSTHLDQIPEDFMVDVVAGQNAVYQAMKQLFQNLKESGETVDTRLKSQAERLKQQLESKFGWGFGRDAEDDDDEDAPVVVDLEEELL